MLMTMRFLVIGAGAIGTYLGVSLASAGQEVVFLEREKDLEVLRQRGLTLQIGDSTLRIQHPACFSNLDEIHQGQFDLAILTIKTYHLQAILPDLILHREELPPILSLQNGVNSERMLAEILGEELVIPGTVTSAVERSLKGQAAVSRSRGLGLGGDHPLIKDLLPVFSKAGLNPRLYQNAEAMKWSKLLINLLGNATSAILDMTTAQVYSHPALYELERNQILEALEVMWLQGIPVVNLPGVPVALLSVVFKYLPPFLSRPLAKKFIGGGRGEKMPSFHIDLHSDRGISEVEDLNGAVVRAGDQLHYPTPVNRLLTGTLVKLLDGDENKESYDHQPGELLRQLEALRSQLNDRSM
jgi:2-dehydropantoate 2-reductase